MCNTGIIGNVTSQQTNKHKIQKNKIKTFVNLTLINKQTNSGECEDATDNQELNCKNKMYNNNKK